MGFKALLLDFYGTIVHEDDVAIDSICREVAGTATLRCDPGDVARAWWTQMGPAWHQAYGGSFRSQRDLCRDTLAATAEAFGSSADIEALSQRQFSFWQTAPLFADARRFLDAVSIPTCIVSNIDRADLETIIDLHGLRFDHIVTSDDVRAYKPRREPFDAAMSLLGLATTEVLHVGDSPTNDIRPAMELGISVAWLHRGRATKPGGWPVDLAPTTVANDFDALRADASIWS